MLKKILFSLVIAIVTLGSAAAQNATIKGRILGDDGKPLEFASVRVMQEGRAVGGATTDSRGEYSISPLSAGTYNLVVKSGMFAPVTVQGIVLTSKETKILDDIKVPQTLVEVIIVYKPEMFKQGNESSSQDFTDKDIRDLPVRGVSGLISSAGGVTNGPSGLTVRAQREGSRYYVDDVPTSSIPTGAVGSVSLISGSLPPEYGDGGSVVAIETKGPSSKVKGEVFATTYVDGHDIVSVDASSTGPLVKAKKENGFSMGYLLSFAAGYSRGPVLWKGYYRASQETIDYLKANPFRPTNDLSSSVVDRNVDFITKYQTGSVGEQGSILTLEEKRARQMQNTWSTSVSVRPKIDIRTPNDMDFSIGGHFSYGKGRGNSFGNTLFNSENNSISESMDWEVSLRFTHRLGGGTEKPEKKNNKQTIKNAYYRLQGYYLHGNSKMQSHIHQDNLFNYGYIGKYEHTQLPAYEIGDVIDTNGDIYTVIKQVTIPQSVLINFTPSDINPSLAQYTISAQERWGGSFPMDEYIQQYKGLLNGENPNSIYGMFTAPGVPYNGVSKGLSDKIGGKALVSFEIRDHAIRFGFDYDQTTSRSYGISPTGLWTLMRNYTNSHIMELDLSNPIFSEDMTVVNYNRLVDKGNQTTFDYNLREKLKKENPTIGEDTWIDVDAYEPSTFDLSMFSAEELFNQGNAITSYYGYDYLGNKPINRSITMSDLKNWFNEGDSNSTRDFSKIGAFKPVKMAAYIQDRFSVKTLYVMLGLRLDIFNANQPCVKDMFLYREAYTVKEAQTAKKAELSDASIPDFMNMSNDFYVYVKDPTASVVDIVAFRNGKTWYNKDGQEISDPNNIAKEEGINQLMPYLKKVPGQEDITKVNYNAFTDYAPTFSNGGVTLSPRIAFSFAVGESSQFSASYNVVTSWSSIAQRFNPVSYLFFEKFANQNSIFANPGLKPERSVNYEIGFKQLINPDMNMEFAAYYSERKDQVVAYQYSQAYPSTYISYTNMDFGTVQGFILGLNMRAGKSKRASFRANYTLQFAKGTGSDPNSTINLLRSGQPNLRQLTILDVDQRHKVNLTFNYGFGPSDGPTSKVLNKKKGTVKEYRILQNAGLSLQVGAGSGFPYTRSSTPYSTIVGQGSRSVDGAINGSRMPWVIDGDLRIYKGFTVTLKKDEKGNAIKKGDIQIALVVQNIIGYKNETSVFSYSGKQTDDGFLTAKEFQQYINNQINPTSFIDYYTIVMEGLNPYGAPRSFKVDVSFLF